MYKIYADFNKCSFKDRKYLIFPKTGFKEEIIIYTSSYDDPEIRNSTYSPMDYLKQYYCPGTTCLDLGCGTCRKIIPVLDIVKSYYAVDCNSSRIRDAEELCSKYKKLILGVCDNYFLPFASGSFDLVSSFMTKYNVPEVWRVLKPNGYFVIEIPGANDRRSLREKFGKDKFGWRGRMLCDSYSDHLERIKAELSTFFILQKAERIQFKTSIKTEKLIALLMMTEEIRNFGSAQDILTLTSMQSSEGIVTFEEERILLVAQKDRMQVNIENDT